MSLDPRSESAMAVNWANFAVWCEHFDLNAIPSNPGTVALYVLDQSAHGKAVNTIRKRLWAISLMHDRQDLDSPARGVSVRRIVTALSLIEGRARSKAAAPESTIRKMVAELGDDLLDRRDRAIILVGFHGALRRSDIVALDRGDLRRVAVGVIDVPSSSGRAVLHVERDPDLCPLRALKNWLSESGIVQGPIFRPIDRHGNISEARLSDRAVALVVKRAASGAGLNPDIFAGHSLRRGHTRTIADDLGTVEALGSARLRNLSVVERHAQEDAVKP